LSWQKYGRASGFILERALIVFPHSGSVLFGYKGVYWERKYPFHACGSEFKGKV